jgi:ribosomal protein L35
MQCSPVAEAAARRFEIDATGKFQAKNTHP